MPHVYRAPEIFIQQRAEEAKLKPDDPISVLEHTISKLGYLKSLIQEISAMVSPNDRTKTTQIVVDEVESLIVVYQKQASQNNPVKWA